MSTDVELVEVLTKRNSENWYDDLIKRAAAGEFHDFQSFHAAPKLVLAEALAKFPELNDIRNDVINGKYDE